MSLLAGALITKRLSGTNDTGDDNNETGASDQKHQTSNQPLPHLAADVQLDVTLKRSFAIKHRKKNTALPEFYVVSYKTDNELLGLFAPQ